MFLIVFATGIGDCNCRILGLNDPYSLIKKLYNSSIKVLERYFEK
jgi:hypothetical protein